jgi:hypothetical protein
MAVSVTTLRIMALSITVFGISALGLSVRNVAVGAIILKGKVQYG